MQRCSKALLRPGCRRSFSSVGIFPRLDYKSLREQIAPLQQNAVRRGVNVDVERLADLYDVTHAQQYDLEQFQRRKKDLARSMKAATAEDRTTIVAEGKAIKLAASEVEAALQASTAQLHTEAAKLPNDTHDKCPDGDEPTVLETVGTKEDLTYSKDGFEPQDHITLGDRHGLFDFEAGARVVGSRFYYSKNEAVFLEMALVNLALQRAVEAGFTPLMPPDLARRSYLGGTGFMPKDGEHQQTYSIQDADLCLVGTSEISVAGMLQDTTVAAGDLPRKYVAFSHCYRNESGGHGQANRGIYRVHQFSKVELFMVTRPQDSAEALEDLVAFQQSIFEDLELHFKVLDMPATDLGNPAFRKVDIEAYMPKHAGGSYGEVSSASNCTDYQSRRLNIRYKEDKKGPSQFAHTLNATAVAVPRTILAIMEQHQQKDGTIKVPKALQPHLMAQPSIPFLKNVLR